MADNLGPLGRGRSKDPLDELGGLVGQTLNLFDGQAAAKGPEQLVDVYGATARATAATDNVIAQSMDLDLLGTSSTAQVAPGPLARSNTFGQEAEIPLFNDEVQIGFTHVVEEVQSPSSSPQNEPKPIESRSEVGPSGYHLVSDGPSTSTGEPNTGHLNEPPLIRVWIREPERVEGTNKLGMRTTYFTYLVRTESQLPGLRTDGSEVRRRFSEFDALHKVVKLQYRGYIIPPLPEKSFIEAKLAHEDFLRLRRADLQASIAFLRGIAQHPVLRESEALKLFLLQPGELQYNPAWTALLHSVGGSMESSEGTARLLTTQGAATATSKAVAGLNSLVSWVRHNVTSSKRELDEEEQQLRHAKELMRDLERLLQLCCESARIMCSHMDSLGADLYELGRNMGMLSKWEETLRANVGSYTEAGFSASKRAAHCKQLSFASARQHTVWKTASVKTAASLVALHDYYIVMPEAVAALEERERCLDQIQALEAELMAKHADLNKTTGGSKAASSNRDRRAYTLTNTVDRLEEQLKVCRDNYVLIKRRNMEELRRLHLTREKDFHEMMASFSALQAQLLQASADMWRTTARQFAGEAVTPAGSAGGPQEQDDD
ncbi:hypothetical protein VOLCADRAFT_96778 [Volvox carteri f. nagariensis]|uniref:PX domain-containing protein n=1 Tax=Volvox carteri f. nagariensis TaxID=3068 RepID=D8UB11_VOLCA|nr:uncharacterized protein VOLCADRAFT_96778 [Volvox carteri f. nagariensis]EFJ43031.1 hypothetical protein VOLCADRAFT_96778 [Volvox carteri f. nagariensis]|eukprot:XP_002955830.1 hypothetical protein VOLCADRAFT_96778 [Volvox carteri f. nagariensis]